MTTPADVSPTTAELQAIDRATLLHPFTPLRQFASGEAGEPRIVTGGQGIRIRLRDGQELIDAFAGIYYNHVGYGRREIADAIHEEALKLACYHSFRGYSNEPEIRLGIPAYFPDDYIPDANQRLFFYKRLASLRDLEELEEIKADIRDRYGAFSPPVENLFLVMNLRRMLKDYLVEQIAYNDGRVSLLFHTQSPVKVEKLVELVSKDKGGLRLTPEGRLSFSPKNQSWDELIPEVLQFLEGLC